MQPFVDLSSLQSVLVLIPKQRRAGGAPVILDAVKAAVLLFVAVLVQVVDASIGVLAARRHAPTSCS